MPKRALIERRPFLLASLLAAMAYAALDYTGFPGLYLIILRDGALGLLAYYAFVRHDGPDARLLMMALAAAAIGDIAMMIVPLVGQLLGFAAYALLLGLFLKPENRPHLPNKNQKIMAVALLLGTPVAAFALSMGGTSLFYGLLPGAMAAAAWISRFARHHAGTGAVLIVFSDLVTIAPPVNDTLALVNYHLIWLLYYTGMFLICTGVIQTLRRDDRIGRTFR